ncbi:Abi-alpha family protein [Pseudorhodobacter aquimaris]|uniref:Abi-alpha family protein n=1 Tax=Pseudorhodobacter aquimaris TaxID=687412 RepID=UPI00067C1830|nr:Abi-alpha family protein [Pseudorhodobacter aquimaris]
MATDHNGGPKTSVDASNGKAIDAALGDVIRGLLKKPSEAVGELVADGIGILGDRVRRKRELNAKLGMEEVRKRLDADGVDMKDITPPKEEELHLLMNGMSLADDESIRGLWAGLFAKALEPNSEAEAERPFISVLDSLSPLDAKIIDLLSFVQRTDNELQDKIIKFAPRDFMNVTVEERTQAERAQKENAALQKTAVSTIRQKAEKYNLSGLGAPGWSDNLMRQGVIERTPIHRFGRVSAFGPTIRDERDLANALGEFNKTLREMEEVSKRQASPPERLFSQHTFGPQLNLEVQLTAFGKRFASACGLIR